MDELLREIKLRNEAVDKAESPDIIGIRHLLSQEHEAISTYENLARDAEDERTRKVLLDISAEEKVHVAELEKLMKELGVDPEAEDPEGEKEVEDLLGGTR